MGKKKRPFYRLVVLDSRKRRDGAYLANVGYYNPFVEPAEVKLHDEEIIAWLKKGATCSGTVQSLLKSQGVLYRYSLMRQELTDEDIAARMTEWRDSAAARTSRQEQKRVEDARKAVAAKATAEAEKAAEAEAAKAPEEASTEEAAKGATATDETAAASAEEAAESSASVADRIEGDIDQGDAAPAEDTADLASTDADKQKES